VPMTEKRRIQIKKVTYNMGQFSKALETLRRAVETQENSEFVQDAAIQRFEYTYELSWKLIKSVLEIKGTMLKHPNDIFSAAFTSEWIQNPETWDAMIDDRNITSHTYKARSADEIYKAIVHAYYSEFRFLENTMKGVLNGESKST
jgi:nucleotidyltransferase substrate binding protein (TIGR01987 family)